MTHHTRLAWMFALLAATAAPAAAPPAVAQTLTLPPPLNETPALTGPIVSSVPQPTTVRIAPPSRPSPLTALKEKLKTDTPAKELLPTAPKASKQPVYLGDDLTRVPEMALEAPPSEKLTNEKWTEHTARALARADHLNGRKRDGFLVALLAERRDLAGLPFLMGDDCRMKAGRSRPFQAAATTARKVMDRDSRVSVSIFDAITDQEIEKKGTVLTDTAQVEHTAQARISALTQVMGAESEDMRVGLVKYLAGVTKVEATQQLARMAVFAPEKAVREAAVEALSVRRERDATDVLVKALRYPWPAVARNAADAIVKLERKDLIPDLVDLLDEADPREPKTQTVDGKKVNVSSELVRVNHHKNCMLCHAPADPDKVRDDTFVADVPLPSKALPSPGTGYYKANSGLLVRVDMTYLRQDFSLAQKVKDADPWPQMQRFDFLVRNRELSDEEAKELREKLTPKEEGELTPYQRVAVEALREMTGRDVEPKAAAWRKLLKLPAK